MKRIAAYAGVSRVPFLALPLALAAAGTAAAAWEGYFDLLHAVLAFVALLALHIAVNVLNEVSDARTGIDNKTEPTPFSGGSKTIPGGHLSRRTAFLYGLLWAAVGLGIGLWFLARFGGIVLPFMILGAIMVLAYSDILARVMLGELAAGLGLGGLAVVGVATMQAGVIPVAAIAAGLPATFMTFNLLLLNEFPDEVADRTGGRRHLVIVLGRSGAAIVYVVVALLTPISILLAVFLDWLPVLALIAMLPTAMLAGAFRWALATPGEPVPIPALGANVGWNHATNLLLAAACLIAAL